MDTSRTVTPTRQTATPEKFNQFHLKTVGVLIDSRDPTNLKLGSTRDSLDVRLSSTTSPSGFWKSVDGQHRYKDGCLTQDGFRIYSPEHH